MILGTRPEIIKLAPVVKELEKRGIDFFILHTGQHFSYNMDRVFFEQLELPQPKYNLGVGSGSHGEQTAKMLLGVERVLTDERPDVVIVQGDTNSTLAGALAAVKLQVPVAHVEAGLRSFDMSMPEEVNRVVVDHVSTLLFAPTQLSRRNLEREGIVEGVYVTGNTIVDAIMMYSPRIEEAKLPLDLPMEYVLLTLHRQENVDNPVRLASAIKGVGLVAEELKVHVIFPVHPRTRLRLVEYGIRVPDGLVLLEPLGYFQFLKLLKGSRVVLTDSGGVQEEACILGVPCVTLRYNTERPETVYVGANVVAGLDPQRILSKTLEMADKRGSWPNPLGDGRAAEKIVRTLKDDLG
ncbi:non-hydrolyzing UDP-N-acetylglucosamine 2-epimerase [Infirmifilum sp.]|uniref:non-hydrolyzing UDP-N-acetylglucosamine 2-epimerase n=1 Tax=Infirmifilum sp. TaxID=2856575 RepID=UPI003D0B64F6